MYRDYTIRQSQKPFLNRSNADIFSEIYEKKLWGVNLTEVDAFFSGPGSYGDVAKDYVACLNKFISDYKIQTITDLGCGNFSIGSQIVTSNLDVKYTACDVVSSLIERNQSVFSNLYNVEFKVLDGSNDDLPISQLLTIRQVFQHLSNRDILSIIKKFNRYHFIIVTEHIFKEGIEQSYNKDKPSGPNIRLSKLSGVYLDKEPFNLQIKEILRCRADFKGLEAYIVSYLIQN